MTIRTGRFSLPQLLNAAREIRGTGTPAFKSSLFWSYFRLVFLGLYGGEDRTVPIAGFRVKYCTVESLLYLFREIFLARAYLFEAGTRAPFIIDCGANIGMATLYFKALYPEAEILAFEPDPDAYACLAGNMAANALAGVRTERAALLGEEGETELYGSAAGPGSLLTSVLRRRADGPGRMVPAVKLSKYVTKPVDLLKMDIEGAETEVLRELRESGRLALVRRLALEYHHHIDERSDSLSGTLKILEGAGFGYQLGASRERPLRPGRFQDIFLYAYNKSADIDNVKMC